ncbi:lipopolysaccharide biosynthesis protein [Shewanella sp. TC10]|uniref:lipopolysaccharide biosynthesis protein n=1 Tax=Shewanella sp. TC10 TaxID=1419739 RepID=UPI00129E2BF3|nr:lipopolysaccharide biosynthesis protein [Shewanella sp. TC10]
MTLKSVNNVEERFKQLSQSAKPKVWNNCRELISLAKEIKTTDILLSRRILQRAKNLQPANPVVLNAIKDISNEINAQKEKLDGMVVKSTETAQTLDKDNHLQIHELSNLANSEKSANSGHSDKSENHLSKSQNIFQAIQDYYQSFTQSRLGQLIAKPWVILLLVPFLLFSFYQLVWASPRYESRAQLIVQQPDGMATMDASMALLTGLGVSGNAGADSELVKAYVYSEDMLAYLQTTNNLAEHYSETGADIFSRLSSDHTKEKLFDFYLNHTRVEIDEKSGVIQVYVEAFTPEFAKELSLSIVSRAEWYINSVGHQLAEAQLKFIQKEHEQVEQRLQLAKKNLLGFQQTNNLLDPEAEGMALQQITYSMESEIAAKRAELKGLRLVMTEQASQVVILKAQLDALITQLEVERQRLSLQGNNNSGNQNVQNQQLAEPLTEKKSVSEVIAQYTDFKIELELALQAYTSSEISLEKSRVEAYRQLKYLVVVERSTLAEDNQYPSTFYNISLFIAIQLMLFGIGKIIIATVKELN